MRTGMPDPSRPPSTQAKDSTRLPWRDGLMVLASALAFGLSGCGAMSRPAPVPKPHPLGEAYGQLYDPAKYQACHEKTPYDSRCRKFILRRNENPELWPYPDVPPMKWPDPPTHSVYRPGMTGVEYWRALCKAEAGEFIYRTVENVDGIYQIRPRRHETDYALMDPYVVEDPYGNTIGEEDQEIFFSYIAPRDEWLSDLPAYSYLESAPLASDAKTSSLDLDPSIREPSPQGARFERYFGHTRVYRSSLKMEWTSSLLSRVGFTWRGIRRHMDRELGVAGGELAVVDLQSNEILGIRRGFILGGADSDGRMAWGGNACPEYRHIDGPGRRFGWNKYYDFGLWFLVKVAKPSGRTYPQ